MSRITFAPLLALAFSVPARADAPAPLAPEPGATPLTRSATPPALPHLLSSATAARLAAGLPKFRPGPPAAGPSASAAVAPDLRETDKPRNRIIRLPNFQARYAAQNLSSTNGPVDPADTDPPRNGLIRLPNYTVTDRKLPPFKERELLTPEGRIDLAFKRHPGLRIGNLFGLNRGPALAMMAEEEALERRREMEDLVSFQQFVATLPPAQSDDAPAATTTADAPK